MTISLGIVCVTLLRWVGAPRTYVRVARGRWLACIPLRCVGWPSGRTATIRVRGTSHAVARFGRARRVPRRCGNPSRDSISRRCVRAPSVVRWVRGVRVPGCLQALAAFTPLLCPQGLKPFGRGKQGHAAGFGAPAPSSLIRLSRRVLNLTICASVMNMRHGYAARTPVRPQPHEHALIANLRFASR